MSSEQAIPGVNMPELYVLIWKIKKKNSNKEEHFYFFHEGLLRRRLVKQKVKENKAAQ